MSQRSIIIVVALVTIFSLGLIVKFAVMNAKRTATINIEVVPGGANIQINGKKAGTGKRKVEPGDYTVSVVKDGFAAETRQVTARAHEEVYVGVSLEPNTAATNNWYQTHTDDAKKVETISSHNFDAASSALADNPLVRKLPYIGAGFEFRIDYGKPRDPNNPGQPIIYIQAKSVRARKDSLQWIRSFGYDPATMDIVFKNVINPFAGH